MKSLYLRIYLTVVAVLLLFAATSAWLFQRHVEQERARSERAFSERMTALGELIQNSLPGADAEPEAQAAALREWSQRLRLPMALDNRAGERVVASDSFTSRQGEASARVLAVRLEDGRTLWLLRPAGPHPGMHGPPAPSEPMRGPGGAFMPPPDEGFPLFGPYLSRGVGLIALLVALFFAVAAGAYPVVRRLTRRLETLKQGVERFGAGELGLRVNIGGRDEVALVAGSFNRAAEQVETLVRSHKSLLANASHELRSPLARMKMAVSMLDDAPPAQREKLKHEIDTNVAELDALVEEVLLASRLDGTPTLERPDRIDLYALACEEAARVDASVAGMPLVVRGEERLLRRALRNLLENARRYGGHDLLVQLQRSGDRAEVQVCDRGPGVPEDLRDRIFEPFYRLPGHAEQAGGVGLGLSLVKQIAERHGGQVQCRSRDGGGSCFVLAVPA